MVAMKVVTKDEMKALNSVVVSALQMVASKDA
jgi:hypothetical protein